MANELKPRPATMNDAAAINEIYNHYVRTSAATFQINDEILAERQEELRSRPENLPMTVLEVDDEVVGWGALSSFKSRCAYRETVELSVYVRHDSHRRGCGRMIVRDVIERARSLGYHTIIAVPCEESVASIGLLCSLGFVEAGRLRQVGLKFGRRFDVIYLQLLLNGQR
jgi:phosphinothricin acetyltransferase